MNRSALFWLLALAAWIVLGVFLSNKYLCGSTQINSTAKASLPVPGDDIVKDATLGAWSFSDGANFKVESKDHLSFLKSKFIHQIPLSSGLDDMLKKTAEYLKANPGRSLIITGYYKEEEKNGSILPNLGLARANDIKNLLQDIDKDIPGSQLVTQSATLSADWFRSDTLLKGVDFKFGEFEDEGKRMTQIKVRLAKDPVRLYFKPNQITIALSDKQKADFRDILDYLSYVPDSKLAVRGYTDNEGRRKDNLTLSRKRADFVRDYLINFGIPSDRIVVKGYGPDKPLESNATEKGKAKNRRVEVSIQ